MKVASPLAVVAAIFCAAGSSRAADLPYNPPAPPIYSPAPIARWTGFYAGVGGGYGGGTNDISVFLARPMSVAPLIPATVSSVQGSGRIGGFLAGGQVGYNYQLLNNVVLGVESDMQWSDIKSHGDISSALARSNGTAFAAQGFGQRGIDWFGTTRLRAGYAFGAFMPYLTGGVAYGQVSASNSGGFAGFGVSPTIYSASATHAGWAAGAGMEYAVTSNLSVKTEYLYVSLGGVSGPAFNIATPPIPPAAGNVSAGVFGAHIVRAGLNWRFGNSGSGMIPGYF